MIEYLNFKSGDSYIVSCGDEEELHVLLKESYRYDKFVKFPVFILVSTISRFGKLDTMYANECKFTLL